MKVIQIITVLLSAVTTVSCGKIPSSQDHGHAKVDHDSVVQDSDLKPVIPRAYNAVPLDVEWSDCSHGKAAIKSHINEGITWMREEAADYYQDFDAKKDSCYVMWCRAGSAIEVCVDPNRNTKNAESIRMTLAYMADVAETIVDHTCSEPVFPKSPAADAVRGSAKAVSRSPEDDAFYMRVQWAPCHHVDETTKLPDSWWYWRPFDTVEIDG